MRINLLGPLSATIDETSVVPSAARPCQVLALLALNTDQLVSKSSLLEELWGQSPPTTATTLHTYIHQLRRHIDTGLGRDPRSASRDFLATGRTGYSLHLHGGDTDVQEFHRLSRDGTRAFELGDLRTASTLLSRALALWRSPVLADVPSGPLLTLEALSLDDLRVAVLNRRIEADLRLGRHLEIMGELRTLAVQNPLNENHAAHYIVALYHAGRIGDALEQFQRVRRTLSEELGVEPAAQLQRLQRSILNGAPAFEDAPMVGVA